MLSLSISVYHHFILLTNENVLTLRRSLRVWSSAGQVCSGCVPQRRDVSGTLGRGLPLRVPSRGLRASVLHSYSPILPAKVFRHVPRAETEIPPDHLINVSGLKVLSVVFKCSFLLPYPSVLFCNHRSSLFHFRPLVQPLVFTLICLFHFSLSDWCCHPWFLLPFLGSFTFHLSV